MAVEDPGKLQHAIEKLVAEANTRLATEGKPTLALAASEEGGLSFHTLTSSDGTVELHSTVWDGYWLLAAQKTILREAVRIRQSGMSLPGTTVFRNALPVDGQQHYSALAFVNASTLGSAIASAVPSSTDPSAQAGLAELRKLLSEASAMSLCVTAERDRILITSTGIDLLNPSRVLSFLSTLQPPASGKPSATTEEHRPAVEI